MDINSLKAFIEVAEQGSFSLAADSLHLTQPAISKRIAVLESDLGTPLFDRIGRQVSLTEGGQTLLPRARRMLDEVVDIRRSLASLKDEIAGTLNMGTSHHIGLRRLPPILRQYSTQYPEVQLDIRFMDSENACSAVEQGRLELGIVTLPTRPSPSLQLTPLWEDPLYIVVNPGHPLADLSQPTLEDLAQHQAILPGVGTYTREILEQALAPKGIQIRAGMSTNYLETLKMLVSIGLGWSLLPGTLLIGEELCVLDIGELHLSRTLGVVQHRKRTLSNAAQAMLEVCQLNK